MKKILIHKIGRYYLSFALVPFLILNSCSNSTEPNELPGLFFETPVINGIIITNFYGPEEIGRWRNPQYPPGISTNIGKTNAVEEAGKEIPGSIPKLIDMDNPFPNPTTDAVVIQFYLPAAAEVSIWFVKGRLPEENPKNVEAGSGGIFVSTKNKVGAVLIDKNNFSAGIYRLVFEGKIEDEYIPPGFYRIYFKAGKHLLWRDILIAKCKADLPPELRDKYFNVGKER